MRQKKAKTGTSKVPPQSSRSERGRARHAPGQLRLDAETLKKLHQLEVQQVELEMQNNELRGMREELDASLAGYTRLYESAPIGYLTLDRHGTVLQLNRQAAALLGGGGGERHKARFDSYLAPGFWPAFSELLAAVALEAGVRDCEAELQRPDGSTVCVQISANYQAKSQTYLLALMDITARREAFRRLHDAEQLAQKLLAQNRHLTRRMFELIEEDRRLVVQEMHKELERGFAAIYHEIAMMLRTEHRLPPEARAGIRGITADLAETQNGLHRIMLRLRPSLLDLAGIAECLREFMANWEELHPGVTCELKLEGNLHGLPDPINVALYRVVQEAMGNVARHARAGRVLVRMTRSEGSVELVIEDDGAGFDSGRVAPGMGMLGMRERVIALGGEFGLASQPGRGTRIEISLPSGLPPEASEGTRIA